MLQKNTITKCCYSQPYQRRSVVGCLGLVWRGGFRGGVPTRARNHQIGSENSKLIPIIKPQLGQTRWKTADTQNSTYPHFRKILRQHKRIQQFCNHNPNAHRQSVGDEGGSYYWTDAKHQHLCHVPPPSLLRHKWQRSYRNPTAGIDLISTALYNGIAFWVENFKPAQTSGEGPPGAELLEN